VAYSGADMNNPDSIAEMIKMTIDSFGRLDVLVNNAGIQHVAPLQEFPTAKWDAILAINLSSAFHTTRLALPSMVANKWGRIINIASAHGLVGSPFKAAYVGAKHGMLGLTKVTRLATERGGASSARPRSRRWRRRSRASPATRSAPVMSTRRWSRRKSRGRPRRTAS